jgi:DtxR family Mn-dependent transcriptional regulator
MAEMHDTTEEYLETILEIEEEGIKPMRARLVERLGLSAAAVSETVGRLVDHGFAELLDDRSLKLTPKGRGLATTVVRRHRLAERLLTDVIGLEWEKVHREADRWEHAISADVEEKLVELLGDPSTCPHGNPIPGTRRKAGRVATSPLNDSDGAVTVARISEKLELSDEGLKLLSEARLIPGCAATVVERDVDGVVVETATGRFTIPREVADQVAVTSGTGGDAADATGSLAASR